MLTGLWRLMTKARVARQSPSCPSGAPAAGIRAAKYLHPLMFCGLAIALTHLLPLVTEQHPTLLFVAAVTISSWWGGIGPGFAAAVIANVVLNYMLPPEGAFVAGAADVYRLAVFMLIPIVIGLLGNARRRADTALHEHEALMRGIVTMAADGIISCNETGAIESFNPAAERIFSRGTTLVEGLAFSKLLAPSAVDVHRALLASARTDRTAEHRTRLMGLHEDGTIFPLDVSIGLAQVNGLPVYVHLLTDVTERSHLERQVLTISDREQRRIGRDLHDGLGQRLTGAAYLATALESRLGSQGLAEAKTAERIQEMIGEAIDETRRLAKGLSPVTFDPHGLPGALREIVERTSSATDITCEMRGELDLSISSPTMANHLFRLAQEAVNNAVKHSGADTIIVQLARDETVLTMSIEDNGKGIGRIGSASTGGGMGIHLMRYRATVMGGAFMIRPGADSGTVVEVMVPLRALEEREESGELENAVATEPVINATSGAAGR